MTASIYSPDLKVEVAFNAGVRTAKASRTWTDVSDYVELDDGITATGGRADERGECDANTVALTVDNSDGRFTPERTSSPYYPNVKIGRPIRVTATYPPASATNLLSANAASVETSVTDWTGFGSATRAQSSTRAYVGTKSMLITWPTGGIPWVQTTVTGLTIGQVYTFSAWVWVPAGAQPVKVGVSGLGNGSPSTVTDAWQRVSHTFTASGTSHAPLFTPSAAVASTAYVDAMMVNVGAVAAEFNTLTPTTYTRFEGYVDEWPTAWPGEVDSYATSQVTASSRIARLGAPTFLRSMVELEILGLDPIAYYPLGEPADSLSASDVGTHAADPLTVKGTGTGVVFGNATGVPTDSLTAATCTPGGKYLRAALTGPTFSALTVMAFYNSSASTSGVVVEVHGLRLRVDSASAVLADADTSAGAFTASDSFNINDGATHLIAATWSGTAVSVYVDGVLRDQTATSGTLDTTPASIGVNNPGPAAGGSFTASHVAVFDSLVSAGSQLAILEAGLTAGADETAAARLARLATYAGIVETDFDTTATTPVSHFDIAGLSHVEPMRRVEATEGGVLYDSRDNTLTYVSRNARYQASPALALSMLAHEVESGITPRYDRSALVNDATATTSLGESVRIVDQASIDEYDPAAVTLDLSTASVVEAAGAAGWAVSTYAQPSTRIPNLTVNLTALSPEKYAAALALDVGSLITVDDWPTQAAVTSGSFFVEGYAESIGLEFHTLTLNVTDATPWLSTLILDDAVRGELDAYTLAY